MMKTFLSSGLCLLSVLASGASASEHDHVALRKAQVPRRELANNPGPTHSCHSGGERWCPSLNQCVSISGPCPPSGSNCPAGQRFCFASLRCVGRSDWCPDDDDGGGGDDDDILRSHTINNLLCAHTISLAELQSTTM
mmetsp:Transcript_26406/g.28398  ORF Transcript_26406/g.28398 Transcript_26406/m.28398 type:complete len:138 (-) Transcript_26406:52-465(-)